MTRSVTMFNVNYNEVLPTGLGQQQLPTTPPPSCHRKARRTLTSASCCGPQTSTAHLLLSRVTRRTSSIVMLSLATPIQRSPTDLPLRLIAVSVSSSFSISRYALPLFCPARIESPDHMGIVTFDGVHPASANHCSSSSWVMVNGMPSTCTRVGAGAAGATAAVASSLPSSSTADSVDADSIESPASASTPLASEVDAESSVDSIDSNLRCCWCGCRMELRAVGTSADGRLNPESLLRWAGRDRPDSGPVESIRTLRIRVDLHHREGNQ